MISREEGERGAIPQPLPSFGRCRRRSCLSSPFALAGRDKKVFNQGEFGGSSINLNLGYKQFCKEKGTARLRVLAPSLFEPKKEKGVMEYILNKRLGSFLPPLFLPPSANRKKVVEITPPSHPPYVSPSSVEDTLSPWLQQGKRGEKASAIAILTLCIISPLPLSTPNLLQPASFSAILLFSFPFFFTVE